MMLSPEQRGMRSRVLAGQEWRRKCRVRQNFYLLREFIIVRGCVCVPAHSRACMWRPRKKRYQRWKEANGNGLLLETKRAQRHENIDGQRQTHTRRKSLRESYRISVVPLHNEYVCCRQSASSAGGLVSPTFSRGGLRVWVTATRRVELLVLLAVVLRKRRKEAAAPPKKKNTF